MAPSSRLTHGVQQEPTLLPGRAQGASVPAAVSRAGLQLGSALALGSWDLLNMPQAAAVAEACVSWPWMGHKARKVLKEQRWRGMGTTRNAQLGLLRALESEQGLSCWLVNQ